MTQHGVKIMNTTELPVWKIIESYFLNENTSTVQLESYNYLIHEVIGNMITGTTFKAKLENEKILIVRFGNVYIEKPRILSDHHTTVPLFPSKARLSDISYESTIYVDIFTKVVHEITKDVVLENTYPYTHFFKIPVMMRSDLCNLNSTIGHHNESPTDYGGYFIIRGKERVIVAQEQISMNHIYVYSDKKSKSDYLAEIRSIKEDAEYSVLLSARIIDDVLVVSLPKKYVVQPIPVGILTRALGIDAQTFFDLFREFPYTHSILKKSVMTYSKWTTDDAIVYISKFTTTRVPETRSVRYTYQILENEIFPHLGLFCSHKDHAHFLSLLVLKLLQTVEGVRQTDDRDHVNNKRVESTGPLIGNLLRMLFKRFIKFAQQHIEKKKDTNVPSVIQKFCLTNRLYHCFSTGNWGIQKSKYIRKGVTQILNRLSYYGTISHLRRIVVPIEKNSKNTEVRHLHPSSFGFICSVESPEGQQCGIIKSLAMITKLSFPISTVMVHDIITSSEIEITEKDLGKCGLFINGIWIGSVEKTSTLKHLKYLRSCDVLHRTVSIGYDGVDHEIHVHSDGGRLLRPLFNLYHPTFYDTLLSVVSSNTNSPKNIWTTLVDEDIIRFVDGYEVDFAHVAMTVDEIKPESEFLEIHPSLMLGTCANMIPFPDHSQAPRNIYSSAMMKQAIGLYTENYQTRFDTIAHVLHYPQKRLIDTRYSEMCGMTQNPCGVNVIVAIACYTGFNMEDSIILNKSAVDRGLFHSTSFKTTSTSETKRGTHGHERIEIPPEHLRSDSRDYSCLDENGIVKKGSVVTTSHILVGKVYYVNEEAKEETSLQCENSEMGIVDAIHVTTNATGYKHVKIRIRSVRIPEVGDKCANLEAQKGTIGATYRQEDMPWSHESDMVPDVILNPHAIPSRMTINMLMEMLCGKACAMEGTFRDATAFCHRDNLVETVGETLKNNGYEAGGDEMFYNGFTGKPFKMKLFTGVCYYQRLKHLVAEKIHSRNIGNVQAMTRQPTEGRSKDGGLRYGEMERDASISHGTSIYLKERLHDMSDPYQVYICEKCGHMIHNHEESCQMCKNNSNRQVAIPYSSKLLFQELTAMGIKVQMK